MLHNQAVAHAERITNDANEQVSASLEHAQRISARAEDYERLTRSQASGHRSRSPGPCPRDPRTRPREGPEDRRLGHRTHHRGVARRRGPHPSAPVAAAAAVELHGRGQGAHPTDGIFSDDSLPPEITGADAPAAPTPAEAAADETPEDTFLGDEVLEDELDDDRPLEKITIDVVETKKKSSK